MNQKIKTILGIILSTLNFLILRQFIIVLLVGFYAIELFVMNLLNLFHFRKLYYLFFYNRPTLLITYYNNKWITDKINSLFPEKELKKPIKIYTHAWNSKNYND